MSAAWFQFICAIHRFRSAREGNVAIIFAIALIPLLGFVGAAIDYSRANRVRTQLQIALDATVLMMARNAPNLSDVGTNSQASPLDSKALAIFTSLFKGADATNVKVNATYSASGGSSVKIDATANVPTTFLAIIGYNTIPVGSSATSKWGSTRLRVALVLDNTGSMAQAGKMAALKTATANLLSQLEAAASTDGDVYVSIIPFTKDVNVGSGNYSAEWIDWDDWESTNGSWQSTTTCSGSSRRGRSRCSSNKTWVPDNHITWNGCVTDRDKNYDQNVTPANPADAALPVGQASTLFPAEQYGNCPVAMMGLNYNWSTMSNLVNSMTPNGNTNQPIGLVWGWMSLVGGGPFAVPAMDTNYKYNQIIILLTDGLNTEDRWYQTQTPIDNRMYQTGNGTGTCANIKAAGITIYTIQVNTGGDPTSTLLQNCASPVDTDPKGTKFFLLTSANQIVTTFESIGTSLTKLRVAK